jgi:hypothetical protein
MGEEGEIATTLWAVSRRLGFQVTRTTSLAKEVLPPAAEATTVPGPDIDSQADKQEYNDLKGS